MSNIILSIVIPGVPRRIGMGSQLVKDLEDQIELAKVTDKVEIIWLVDNYKRSIGYKRQALVELAQGKYVVFIDDDDKVPAEYITKILSACEQDPDVITFKEDVDWNGSKGIIEFGLHNTNEPFKGNNQITKRRPWHVCVWRSSIAKQCTFPDLNWGEDSPWVDQATPLAKTEIHIPEILHIYAHYDNTSESTRRMNK